MSRAFLSESDAQYEEDDVPEIKYPLPPGVKNYATPAGAERLRKELHTLANIKRPKTAAAISRLVSTGASPDLEALSAQRRRLREIDRKIAYLTKMIANIEVIDPRQQGSDRVLFGATVTVQSEQNAESTYQIVGIDESNPPEGRVGWVSPIARAMISARVGDIVTLKLPNGESKLKILKIEYL